MRRSLAPRSAAVPLAVEGTSLAPASEGKMPSGQLARCRRYWAWSCVAFLNLFAAT